MKRPAIAAAALFVLTLTGCASGGATADDAYLSTVRETAPDLAGTPDDDAELIRIGQRMCEMFDEYGYDEAYEAVVTDATDPTQAAVVAGAAVGAYCPEFSDEVG